MQTVEKLTEPKSETVLFSLCTTPIQLVFTVLRKLLVPIQNVGTLTEQKFEIFTSK